MRKTKTVTKKKKSASYPWKTSGLVPQTALERSRYIQECIECMVDQMESAYSKINPLLSCEVHPSHMSRTVPQFMNTSSNNSTLSNDSVSSCKTTADHTVVSTKITTSAHETPSNHTTSPSSMNNGDNQSQPIQTCQIDYLGPIEADVSLPCSTCPTGRISSKVIETHAITWSHWPQPYTIHCKECIDAFVSAMRHENDVIPDKVQISHPFS